MITIIAMVLGGLLGWAFVSILQSAGLTRHHWQLWAAILCMVLAECLIAIGFSLEKVA